MKRRLVIAAVFLLAGAVVNVAVAWGWAVSRPSLWLAGETSTTGVAWVGRVCEERSVDCGALTEAGIRYRGVGYDAVIFLRVESKLLVEELSYWRIGLPYLSVQGSHYYELLPGPRNSDAFFFALPSPVRGGGGMLKILPLRPIWPGFLANTLIFAAPLWLLIPGPFVLRRFIRVKRGLCVKCAYPMGESAVCTECGKAMPGCAETAT